MAAASPPPPCLLACPARRAARGDPRLSFRKAKVHLPSRAPRASPDAAEGGLPVRGGRGGGGGGLPPRPAAGRRAPAREGPVLLVGNHGVWGYETPAFFHLVHQATGRYPLGPGRAGLLPHPPGAHGAAVAGRRGGHAGQRAGGAAPGHLVVCYPGGARETFKRGARALRLRWERRWASCGWRRRRGCPSSRSRASAWMTPSSTSRGGAAVPAASRGEVPHAAGDGAGAAAPAGALTFAVGEPHEPPPPDAPERACAPSGTTWPPACGGCSEGVPCLRPPSARERACTPAARPGTWRSARLRATAATRSGGSAARPVRLFTFPGGSEDVARTVVCLPGLGASGRSFAPHGAAGGPRCGSCCGRPRCARR